MNKLTHTLKTSLLILLASIFLQACSGESFHLRGQGNVPTLQESFYIEGVNLTSPLGIALRNTLKQSGSRVVHERNQASLLLQISSVSEGKIAAGYSRARKVREYDVFLRLNYAFRSINGKTNYTSGSNNINTSRTQLYDSDFALGKAEEEEAIRQELRQNAARLILVKLRYSQKKKNNMDQKNESK